MHTATTSRHAIIDSAYDFTDEATLGALADSYEEEGDAARAELVRVQAELEEWPFQRYDLDSPMKRERQLLAENKDRWLAGVPRLPGIEYEFFRGLLRAVAEDPGALRRNASELAKMPEVRAVRLKRLAGVERLSRCEELRHFKSLSLHRTRLGLKQLQALADSPYLAGLTELVVASTGLQVHHLLVIEKAQHWKRLVRLDVSGNTARGKREMNHFSHVFAILEHLPCLQVLEATGNDIPEWALNCLLPPRQDKPLATLPLRACHITDKHLWKLASVECLPALSTLDLSWNANVTSDGLLELAEAEHPRGLSRLKLAGTRVGLHAMKKLKDRFRDVVWF